MQDEIKSEIKDTLLTIGKYIFIILLTAFITYSLCVESIQKTLTERYTPTEQLLEEVFLNNELTDEQQKTLAEKNNNPLNVKANDWLGQVGIDEFGHAIFTSNEYGIRAGASVLMNYYHKHKIDTITGIVNRFCTGNRKQYIKFLCQRLNLTPIQKFDVLKRLPELLQAMARFESAKDWDYTYFIPYSLVKNAYEKGKEK